MSTETPLCFVLGLVLAVSYISYIEPSPYDIIFFALIPTLILAGTYVGRATICLFFFVFLIVSFEFVSLLYHLDNWVGDNGLTPTLYAFVTLYVYLTAIVFSLVFSKNTGHRLKIALNAYAFSCVVAGSWAILSYLNLGGLGDREPIGGRIAGSFKDPNVLGSYCVMGTIYLTQSAMIGSSRFRILRIVGAMIALCGVLLSFSRGSTAAVLFSFLYLTLVTYWTADNKAMRQKVVRTLALCFLLLAAGGVFVAQDQHLRETIAIRAQPLQDYDSGETGRFGQQKRSIPMLLERPLGFGPYRFPFYFGLQPHNSYVNAFAEAGWVGGVAFILLSFTTCWLAVRQSLQRSPFMRHAQVVAPVTLAYFLQAIQIDIDHWRFVFFAIGAVWGMEVARQRLMAQSVPAFPRLEAAF